MTPFWRRLQRPSKPRPVLAQLLASDAVRQAIGTRIRDSGQPALTVEREARELLDTLLPELDRPLLKRLNRLCSPLFRHMYQPLDIQGLATLAPLSQTHRLVYLPCHRSHMDYLLLAWALHTTGLEPPHILAGDNLNLPLIGTILRRCGALFMRRSFHDDPFYSALFRAGLAYSLQHQPLEFFIEGGRSRSGRLLPPRLGALRLTLQQQPNLSRPLALVPVAINYDLCLENRQYQQELAGQPKRRETLFGTLLSAGTLMRRCGGCYLSIGEPLRLDAEECSEPLALAQTLLERINSATVAAPVAQIASLLLASPDTRLTEPELHQLLNQLNPLLHQLGTPTPVPAATQDWIDAAVRRRQLSRSRGHILATPAQAAGLCFYRNTLLHALALPGLLLLLARRLPHSNASMLTRLLRALLPYLDAELHLPSRWQRPGAPGLLRNLLLEQGLLVRQGQQLRPANSALTRLLMLLVEPLLLRQYLLIRLLAQHRRIAASQLLELSATLAEHIHGWYGHSAPDYADRRQLTLLIDQLVAGGLLQRQQEQVQATRDLTPLLRIGSKLLPAVLLQECERWLTRH